MGRKPRGGTSSDFPGWYVNLQAAVLQQLPRPREIDQTIAEGWTHNQSGLKKSLTGVLVPPALVQVAAKSTTSHKHAREIMDKNFFGVEEAIKYFGVNPTKQQLAALAKIPFAEETLKLCNDTHVLVAVFPISILEIRGKVESGLFCPLSHKCDKYAFAKKKGWIEWRLIRKTEVTNSTFKSWQEQQPLLANNEEVPNVRVMIYTIIGHFLATGEQLFDRMHVRTSSINPNGGHVDVSNFFSGICIDSYSDGYHDSVVGLASAKKPDA